MYLTHPLRLVAQGPKATNHSFVSTGGGVATKLGPEFRTVTSGVRSPCLSVHVYLASRYLGCVSSGRYSSPSQPAPHRRGGGGTAAILTPVPAVGQICCLRQTRVRVRHTCGVRVCVGTHVAVDTPPSAGTAPPATGRILSIVGSTTTRHQRQRKSCNPQVGFACGSHRWMASVLPALMCVACTQLLASPESAPGKPHRRARHSQRAAHLPSVAAPMVRPWPSPLSYRSPQVTQVVILRRPVLPVGLAAP